MSIKLTKQEQKEHAQLAEELKHHNERVRLEFAALLEALRHAPIALNVAIQLRNVVAKRAEAFAEAVHDRMRDEFDDKSERWQEGDAGQEASSFIEEWDGVNVEQFKEVAIVEPEVEGEAGNEFGDLPHEPS